MRKMAFLLVSSLLLARGSALGAAGEGVREPAVAGQFYPADPAALREAVAAFLQDAAPVKARDPVGIVVPHAGYIYSGQIAADGWKQAEGGGYDLIVILGTNHASPPFPGVALLPGSGFRTPLGTARIDGAAVKALAAADPDCRLDAGPHAREHSVEVQVPFAQVLFPQARILAAVVGSSDPALCERLGLALAKVLAGRRALVVASSDLAHYPSSRDAARADRETLGAIATLDPAAFRAALAKGMSAGVSGLSTCACGEASVSALMAAAKGMGAARGVVAGYSNSGETLVGEAGRAVGYGAVAFDREKGGPDTRVLAPPGPIPPPGPLSPAERKALLAFARKVIGRYLSTGTVPLPRGLPEGTRVLRGAFVTLKRGGELRGCIGHMAEDTPLARVVGEMALQAAFNDRRFPPVSGGELPSLAVEISALTPMKRVAGAEDIVVGRDGVLLVKGGRSAVFLPQVAPEQGWGREQTLGHLCLKAGLPEGCWKEGASFSTFQAEVFGEES